MPTDTILLVGEGLAQRESPAALLADLGYRLEFATDGLEAATRAETLGPELILIDAGAGGPDICRRLRTSPPLAQLPLLVALSPADHQARAQVLEAGADDVVAKPYDHLELQARVRTLSRLGRHRSAHLRLAAEIDKRDRQLQTLQSAGATITSGLDLQHTLDAITREMTHLLRMKACAIWGFDHGNRTLFVQSSHGPDGWWGQERQAECRSLADCPWMDGVLTERRARCVSIGPGLAADERAFMERAGLQVVLYLPMTHQDSVLGLVEVADDGTGPTLTAEDIALAQLLANQAASVIENARLYDAVRRHIAEVTTLNKISQVITSILDLRETLAIIADHAHWLLDVAAASVILCDEERGDLWFGAASGEGSEFIRGKRLSKGKGIVNWVIEHGQPLVVPDTAQDPRFFDEWDKAMDYTTRSILCVPLKTQRQTIGAIEAINKASGPFDQEDLNLLTSMAASAAVAIENARLYRELQDHANTLEQTVAERTRELQAERDRTQAILEAVGEAVIVTDLDGRVRYLNPAAVALTGYTLQEALGRSSQLWQGDGAPGEPRPTPPPVEDRAQTQRAEVISRRKDGTLYDAAMTVAPLFDSQQPGRLVGHVCVQRDITPIKEAERLKDQFVSNVSHELRTPLSVIALISGNLDRLYERLPHEKRKDMVRDIRGHAQVLTDLVGDVLEISRIESGRISMERERIDLAQLVREEVGRQWPLAQKQAQELQVAGVQHLGVWGNGEQLRLIVRNLLNNAIKYTPRRGWITCECQPLTGEISEAAWPGSDSLPAGSWAAMRVADSGIGIGREDLSHVFERFYRVKAQGNIPGTGLGLSIVKELADAHGGHVAAASTLGQGSIFAVYLPRMEE